MAWDCIVHVPSIATRSLPLAVLILQCSAQGRAVRDLQRRATWEQYRPRSPELHRQAMWGPYRPRSPEQNSRRCGVRPLGNLSCTVRRCGVRTGRGHLSCTVRRCGVRTGRGHLSCTVRRRGVRTGRGHLRCTVRLRGISTASDSERVTLLPGRDLPLAAPDVRPP